MNRIKNMIYSIMIFLITLLTFIFSCQSINDSGGNFLLSGVEGNWKGYLETDSLFLTFIEGRFENSPTLSGSGHISAYSTCQNYLIMGGTLFRPDSLLFSLCPVPFEGKKSFLCRGQLRHDTLSGSFAYYDSSGLQLGNGLWWSKRIP